MNKFLLGLLKLLVQTIEAKIGDPDIPFAENEDIFGNRDTKLQSFIRQASAFSVGFDGEE